MRRFLVFQAVLGLFRGLFSSNTGLISSSRERSLSSRRKFWVKRSPCSIHSRNPKIVRNGPRGDFHPQNSTVSSTPISRLRSRGPHGMAQTPLLSCPEVFFAYFEDLTISGNSSLTVSFRQPLFNSFLPLRA